jgi:hypothetical protein
MLNRSAMWFIPLDTFFFGLFIQHQQGLGAVGNTVVLASEQTDPFN